MNLNLEIFFTKIDGVSALYHLVPTDLSQDSEDPDSYVRSELKKRSSKLDADEKNCIIHSTSWRYEQPGTIVLTYMVYSDDFNLSGKDSKHALIKDLRMADDAGIKKSKSPDLSEIEVFTHGLRHLSYLIERSPTYREVLKSESIEAFNKVGQALAGKIN